MATVTKSIGTSSRDYSTITAWEADLDNTGIYSAGDDAIQTLDLIEACGDGESFCRSNILKYASRYDKKGTARRDILKILHYAVLLMHFNDKNAKRETYPQ